MTTCQKCEQPTGRRLARYCDACRWKLRGKPAKWIWTPERDELLRTRYSPRVKGRAAEIALALAMPRWAVTNRAAFLGLAVLGRDRKAWTDQQDAFIEASVGSRHVEWISRELKRSVCSVTNRIKRLKISRRWREGYTLRELELCFGVDHHGIDKWIRLGQLRGRRRLDNGAARDAWLFTDADLLQFISEHPTAFHLSCVDQVWFLDLLRAGGVIRRALADAQGAA